MYKVTSTSDFYIFKRVSNLDALVEFIVFEISPFANFKDFFETIPKEFKVYFEIVIFVGTYHKLLKQRALDLYVGSVVEWLKRRTRDQHDLGSKPTLAILLCSWERHFTAHSPAWWSWQAVLNYSHISIKL